MATLHESTPRWLVILSPWVVLPFALSFVSYLVGMWPETTTDPAFFQHTGWYILNGGVPYVDVWDVNPPLVFGLTAVLAALAGGDMVVLQTLSGVLMTAVNAASVLLVGWLAHHLTGDDAAAVAAGLVVLLAPAVYLMPPVGTRAQFYALLFGLVALAFALRDRPVAAGASAAASAGCWQPGAGLVFLVIGMAAQRSGRRGALAALTGVGVLTGLVVSVFAAAGALVPMGVETILAPLVAGEPYTLPERVYAVLLRIGYGTFVLPVAVYGWGLALVHHRRTHWWVPAGGLLFGLQVLFVDMDGATDMVFWLAFVAFGVAIAVASVTPSSLRLPRVKHIQNRRWIFVGVIGLIVLSGPIWHATSPPLESTLRDREERAMPDAELPPIEDETDVPDMETIYWQKLTPEACHYRLSRNEIRWIHMTDDRVNATRCGRWPGELRSLGRDTAAVFSQRPRLIAR